MDKKKTYIIYAALGVLLALVVAVGSVMIAASKKKNDELGDKLDDLGKQGEQLNDAIDSLESNKSELEKSKSQLESEVASLKSQLAGLEAKLSDAGKSYEDEIKSLKAQIEQKNAEIASLEADIAKFTTVYTIDIRKQAQLIDELVEYIESACPYVRVKVPILDEKTGEETGEYNLVWTKVEDLENEAKKNAEQNNAEYVEGSWREREDIVYPRVSVYYEDLATGYHFGYNEDEVYNSASVIKAPYICSVLETIAADEKRYLDSLDANGESPERVDNDGDGIAETTVIKWSNPAYDLSETVIYNKATMFKSGSGKIQEMDDGTEFSYYDFIKYALEYSDNIAYQQLRKRFGFSTMTSLAQKVGASSVLKNGSNMTARDAGKLFKEIWRFVESDEKYGGIMKTSMQKANHTVIIPLGVSPSKALHKYGWDTDAYHDAGIVMSGDKPYVLAVFSDLDKGGDAINEYLRGIVKLLNQLHKNFYQ